MDWLTPELITTLVSVAGAVLTAVFGSKFMKYKKVAVQIAEAMADGKLTVDETRAVVRSITQAATGKEIQERNADNV